VSQTILVLVAIVMIGGGGYVLFSQAASSTGMSRFVVSSILVILLGLYLLWDAFLR
jgi:ABC-type nickel/cobalt efflux system permease component RcnA